MINQPAESTNVVAFFWSNFGKPWGCGFPPPGSWEFSHWGVASQVPNYVQPSWEGAFNHPTKHPQHEIAVAVKGQRQPALQIHPPPKKTHQQRKTNKNTSYFPSIFVEGWEGRTLSFLLKKNP